MQIDSQRETKINELIFVAMAGREGGLVGIEANLGLVAFGDSRADLIADIKDKVLRFKTDFDGQIRLREFIDTVFECR